MAVAILMWRDKMNRQRKVLVTVTYNELGVIVDTKTEELDSSAQPVLRTEMSSANDTISRQAAIGRAVELPLFGKQVKVVAVRTGRPYATINKRIWEGKA